MAEEPKKDQKKPDSPPPAEGEASADNKPSEKSPSNEAKPTGAGKSKSTKPAAAKDIDGLLAAAADSLSEVDEQLGDGEETSAEKAAEATGKNIDKNEYGDKVEGIDHTLKNLEKDLNTLVEEVNEDQKSIPVEEDHAVESAQSSGSLASSPEPVAEAPSLEHTKPDSSSDPNGDDNRDSASEAAESTIDDVLAELADDLEEPETPEYPAMSEDASEVQADIPGLDTPPSTASRDRTAPEADSSPEQSSSEEGPAQDSDPAADNASDVDDILAQLEQEMLEEDSEDQEAISEPVHTKSDTSIETPIDKQSDLPRIDSPDNLDEPSTTTSESSKEISEDVKGDGSTAEESGQVNDLNDPPPESAGDESISETEQIREETPTESSPPNETIEDTPAELDQETASEISTSASAEVPPPEAADVEKESNREAKNIIDMLPDVFGDSSDEDEAEPAQTDSDIEPSSEVSSSAEKPSAVESTVSDISEDEQVVMEELAEVENKQAEAAPPAPGPSEPPADEHYGQFTFPQRVMVQTLDAANKPFGFVPDSIKDILGLIGVLTMILSTIVAALILLWID